MVYTKRKQFLVRFYEPHRNVYVVKSGSVMEP